jgi:hypothetical protein
MTTPPIVRRMVKHDEVVEGEWVSFPGGELEGQKPKVMCPTCRARLRAEARAATPAVSRNEHRPSPICFECYRVDLARQRALHAARNLNSASETRFQGSLPFEPIDRARLVRLRAERATVRAAMNVGTARFVDKRRRAQIAARHVLERLAAGLGSHGATPGDRERFRADAVYAAELQLPEAWLPFVVSR